MLKRKSALGRRSEHFACAIERQRAGIIASCTSNNQEGEEGEANTDVDRVITSTTQLQD